LLIYLRKESPFSLAAQRRRQRSVGKKQKTDCIMGFLKNLFASLRITARELRGGTLIFIFPQTALAFTPT